MPENVPAPTVRFQIYGASDDLVETNGISGCDEFGAYPLNNEPSGFAGSFVLAGPGGSMRILAFYAPFSVGPCWTFAPMQMDEDVPFPDWPLRIHSGKPARGYSTVLEIDVPVGTVLVREDRGE